MEMYYLLQGLVLIFCLLVIVWLSMKLIEARAQAAYAVNLANRTKAHYDDMAAYLLRETRRNN